MTTKTGLHQRERAEAEREARVASRIGRDTIAADVSLPAGTRIGPYEITGSLGAGGMGEVYRARDSKLQREVAIKVLPDLFAADPDRLARFEREAQTLAALNHPNIAAIYGLESLPAGGYALVMELVEGEDLSQRIARGSLQIDDARAIAKQIAEALEAAHERGIVHRDLKPGNVKLTPDGTAKVLDFGLAKAAAGAESGRVEIANSPTFTSPAMMTQMGVILGTAAYMAPEQARGKAVDRRADIWAFGCVLYEMLTGRMPFSGETVTDTLSAIVSREPDWSALPAATPESMRRLLRRCLVQRDDAILAVPFDFTRVAATGDAVPFLAQRPSFQRLVFANIPLFAVASNGVAVFSPWSTQEDDTPLVMVEPGGKASRLNLPAHRYSDPRVSPDGTRIAVHVFEATRDNWIADLRRGTFMRLTFDPGEDETPCWSPDGRWVYWTASRATRSRVIYRKAADGTGPEQEIWKGNTHVHLGGVTPDGATIVMSTVQGQATQIVTVNVADGKETPLVTTPFANQEPAISPDGKWLAYASDESGRKEVYVQPYPSMQGRTQISAAGGAQPVWARTGSTLFYRGSEKIMTVDIAMKGGIEASAPRVVMDDTYESTQANSHTAYDVTRDGRFLMVGKRPAAQGSVNHLQIIYAGR